MTAEVSSNELKIIEELNREPQSTKGLMSSLKEFTDRASLCIFLNSMMRKGLIYKQSNGYWKLQKGVEASFQISTEEGIVLDKVLDYVPVFTKSKELPVDKAEDPEKQATYPEPSNTSKATIANQKQNIELAVQSVRDILPENCQLAIGAEGVWFMFDGLTFTIEEPGDIDAALIMRQRYVGSDAA